MQPSLERLQKFLKLEAERNFDNRAVVGGLDKILVSWEAQARIDNLPEAQIQTIIQSIKQYPELESPARAEAIKQLWAFFQSTRDETPAPIPAPRKESPSHASRPKEATSEEPKANTPATQSFERHHSEPVRHHHIDADEETAPRVMPYPSINANNPGLNAPLSVINGIGAKHAEALESLNLRRVEDLLYFFPRRYDDYSQLKTICQLKYGEEATIIANVENISDRQVGNNKIHLTEVIVNDGTGSLRLNWFNQPWQSNRLKLGIPVSISGKIEQFLGRPVMTNPECETINQDQLNTNRIVPVYPLTGTLTQHWVRRIQFQTVNFWAPRLPDYLSEDIRTSVHLMDLSTALLQCHFPTSEEQLKAAQTRIAFDEIFLLQLGVMNQRRKWHATTAHKFNYSSEEIERLVRLIPFTLTHAQEKAVADIQADLASGSPMNRLLQGDVGSGKTAVAALGIAMVASQGAQAALMAPTSILAEQHYRSLSRWFVNSENPEVSFLKPEEIRLLTGATPEDEKKEIYAGLESGLVKVVIGTHALIEDTVAFNNLQFIVVDEQHRFGVEQRAMLRSKGENPHILVMTATPIPRSLALTLYGDLDLSILDELPAGRQVVSTHLLEPKERERAYSLIRSQIQSEHQVFIIYPLIEKGDDEEDRAAVEEHERLQKDIFPKFKIGLLHGRMKPEDKDQVMKQFRDGEYQILVSTSVVEVGVDVPNATVMLIEGANHFGLAQLHQFRGRVGRGEAKSYCLLIPDAGNGFENQRLSAMVETNDGFVLAQKDLEMRGPGEFLGTQQSGYPELKMAKITDLALIEKARTLAQELFAHDPDLTASEHQLLFQKMQLFWKTNKGEIS